MKKTDKTWKIKNIYKVKNDSRVTSKYDKYMMG